MTLEIENEEFFNSLDKEKTIVIDFYAKWCGPCQLLMPTMDEISELYADNDKISIIKVDVENIPTIVRRFEIMSVPTILFFRNGKLADFLPGFTSKEKIIEKIEKNI